MAVSTKVLEDLVDRVRRQPPALKKCTRLSERVRRELIQLYGRANDPLEKPYWEVYAPYYWPLYAVYGGELFGRTLAAKLAASGQFNDVQIEKAVKGYPLLLAREKRRILAKVVAEEVIECVVVALRGRAT